MLAELCGRQVESDKIGRLIFFGLYCIVDDTLGGAMIQLMTVRKVSQSLGVSTATVRRLIKERRLDHVRFGRRIIRIPIESVDSLLNSNGKNE